MNDMTVKIVLGITFALTLTFAVSFYIVSVRKSAKGKAVNMADATSGGGDMTGGSKIDNRRGKVDVGGDLVLGNKSEFNINSRNSQKGKSKK